MLSTVSSTSLTQLLKTLSFRLDQITGCQMNQVPHLIFLLNSFFSTIQMHKKIWGRIKLICIEDITLSQILETTSKWRKRWVADSSTPPQKTQFDEAS